MNGKLGMAILQISLGIVICCAALIRTPQQTLDGTKTAQSDAQPTQYPNSIIFGLCGTLVTAKGLWDLYKTLFYDESAPVAENAELTEVIPQYPVAAATKANRYSAQPPATNSYPNYTYQPSSQAPNTYTTRTPIETPYPKRAPASIVQNLEELDSGFTDAVFQSTTLPNRKDENTITQTPVQQPDYWSDDDNDTESEDISPELTPPSSIPTGHAYIESPTDTKIKSSVIHQIAPEFFLPLRSYLKENILSWVLCGPPGIGKTTLLLAWIADTVTTNKGVKFFINGWKNDAWLGLAALPDVYKRNTIAQPTGQLDFTGFFFQVSTVADILYDRLGLPEDERPGVSKVWLVLDDYFATSDALNKAKGELGASWEIAKAQISQIITLGREVGVGLCAGTHSFNVKALGLDDANIRGCLGICALGKIYSTPAGRKEGGYDTITNVLKNNYIIPPEYLNNIAPKFNALRPLSQKHGYAIALTTFGEPHIGLINEDLSWVKTHRITIAASSSKTPQHPPENTIQHERSEAYITDESTAVKSSKFIPFPKITTNT